MVITRIKSSKNFLDDGFVKTFFNTTYDDHNMQCLPNKILIFTFKQNLIEYLDSKLRIFFRFILYWYVEKHLDTKYKHCRYSAGKHRLNRILRWKAHNSKYSPIHACNFDYIRRTKGIAHVLNVDRLQKKGMSNGVYCNIVKALDI